MVCPVSELAALNPLRYEMYATSAAESRWPSRLVRAAARPLCALLPFALLLSEFPSTVAMAATSPAFPTRFPTISGISLFVIVKPNGTIAVMGDPELLPIGDGSERDEKRHIAAPIAVRGVSGVAAAAVAGEHAVLLMSDGTLQAWGETCAALGIYDDAHQVLRSPQRLPLKDVVEVAVTDHTSAAILKNGRVVVWGAKGNGAMGIGDYKKIDQFCVKPRYVHIGNVVHLAAGSSHMLALLKDGTVGAFGNNVHSGVLGDGTELERLVPVPVRGLTDVIEIAAGDSRSYALQRNGTVWQWGKELSPAPVAVKGLGKAVHLWAKRAYAIVQVADGSFWGWGEGYNGVLASGSADKVYPTPIKVANAGSFATLAAVHDAVFAWRDDNTLWGWGQHGFTLSGAAVRGTSGVAVPLLKWDGADRFEPAGPQTSTRSSTSVAASAASAGQVNHSMQAVADKASAKSLQVVAARGATLSVTGRDGTVYRLTLPPKALPKDAIVTLTPLTGIKGIPGQIAHYGVDIAPAGTELLRFATLEILPTTPLPKTAWWLQHTGTPDHLTARVGHPLKGGRGMFLTHFSGGSAMTGSTETNIGLQCGLGPDRANPNAMTPWLECARNVVEWDYIAGLIGEAVFDGKMQTITSMLEQSNKDDLARAIEQAEQRTRQKAAETDEVAAQGRLEDMDRIHDALVAAINDERVAELSGREPNPDLFKPLLTYAKAVISKCDSQPVPVKAFLSLARDSELLGQEVSGKDFSRCLCSGPEKPAQFCTGSYEAKGQLGEVSFSGTVCDLRQPYHLEAVSPVASFPLNFQPSSEQAGQLQYAGTMVIRGRPVHFDGTGHYDIVGGDAPKAIAFQGTNCDEPGACHPFRATIDLQRNDKPCTH